MIENTERQADRSAPLPDWSACLEFGPKVQQNIEVLGGRVDGLSTVMMLCKGVGFGREVFVALWRCSRDSDSYQCVKVQGLGGVTNVATPTAPPYWLFSSGLYKPVNNTLIVWTNEHKHTQRERRRDDRLGDVLHRIVWLKNE